MKKKIKDLTIEEAHNICEKYCDKCKKCPFWKFSCLDFSFLSASDLEKEIKI